MRCPDDLTPLVPVPVTGTHIEVEHDVIHFSVQFYHCPTCNKEYTVSTSMRDTGNIYKSKGEKTDYERI